MASDPYGLGSRKDTIEVPNGDWYNAFKELADGTLYGFVFGMFSDGVRSPAVGESMGATIDTSTKRMNAGGTGFCGGLYWALTTDMEANVTAATGSTTHLTDTGLTVYEDDWWNDAWRIPVTGTNAGENPRQVSDFVQSSGRLEWADPFPSAVTAGDTFVVSFRYIESLTTGTTNWIWGRKTSRTRKDYILRWFATTSSTKTEGDILVATMVLDASGSVSSVDYEPVGHDRHHYPDEISDVRVSGTLLGLPPGGSVDVEVTHVEVVSNGFGMAEVPSGITAIAIADPDTGELPTPTSFWLRFTNETAYTADVSYTAIRRARRRYPLT